MLLHYNQHSNEYLPLRFELSKPDDRVRLEKLLNDNPGVVILNEIRSQVGELIKSRNASRIYQSDQLSLAIDEFFSNMNPDEYGCWFYYPWINSLIHLLPENEFIEVRTNRNRNKITTDEQRLLSNRKVGVIGLSVGQAVATTLALERICGELRIADFDILELSNLNRIRTGLKNLGLNKTISVAREIAEMDPYLKVVCFHEGITNENLDAFLTEGGKLDVLIDESDGLEIKISCRERARHFKIPVLMEASERGVVDVERFDLEPERPILHGLLDGMDLDAAKRAKTNEEKVPFMMEIVGLDSLSDRMRSSILEIAQSITTWPQLASAVTYGGGMTADICRRILLDQYRNSGRYIVDIADLVNDDVMPLRKKEASFELPPSSSGRDFGALIETRRQGLEVPENILSTIVETACMAPSGGNSQPWKWIYRDRALYLFHEIDLSTQWLDYKNRGSHISFGAALENLELEAIHQGYETEIELVTDEDSLLVATIIFHPLSDSFLEKNRQRFEHYYPLIRKRITNRYMGNEQPIDDGVLENLKKVAAEIPGARLSLVNERNDLLSMSKVVGISDKLLLTNEQSHQEFFKEIKWSKEEAEKARVGIDVRTVELSASELAGFNVARSWNAVKNLVKWGGGSVFERLGTKMIKSSSALALLTMPEYSRKDFIEGGRALQRVWMEANARGVCVQPMSAAIFLFARLVHGNGDGLSERMAKELQEIRKEHLRCFNTPNDAGEVFLFRLFYAGEPKVLSMRKHLSDVFEYHSSTSGAENIQSS